jgi:hypothetical protein
VAVSGLGSETVCSNIHLEASGWMQAQVSGDLVLPGPWKGILRSKKAGKYQPVRFTVHGEIVMHTTPNLPPPLCPDWGIEITVKYLGRGGEEVEVAHFDGIKSGEKHSFEKSIDISKWRGPGLQGVSIWGWIAPKWITIPLWCSYTSAIDGRICFTLTWVD